MLNGHDPASSFSCLSCVFTFFVSMYRGRGRGGFRRGDFGRSVKQVSFELFPEIEGLGKAEFSTEHIRLIMWSEGLKKFWRYSPYYVEDRSKQIVREQPSDVERYSDRNLPSKKAKPPLSHYIKLGPDYMPAELALGGEQGKRAAKRVRWNFELDSQKEDPFDKLLQKEQEQEGKEVKENESEEEEEEEIIEEDEGEYSDEGDYEQNEYFDDDEDDFNMPEDNDDEPIY